MKVALLLFGQPRYIETQQAYDCYKHTILDKYDTDVFCHTWWDESIGEYDYSTFSNISSCPINPDAISIISKFYKPVRLLYEKPRKFKLQDHIAECFSKKFPTTANHSWQEKNYSNTLSHLYSIKMVTELLEAYCADTNKSYDWIVLARYDTVLDNFPDLNTIDPGKFYLSNQHPRFPDMIFVYGFKFIGWGKNIKDDIETEYNKVWEPSPESFKYYSFVKRYDTKDITTYPMNAYAIRK